MHLRERHRPRLEPTVQNFRDPAHHGFAGWVVRVRPDELVDIGTVQVGRPNAEIGFDLIEAAVHIEARVLGIVAAPYGDGGAPESVATDRPVTRALEPLPETAVLHVVRDPIDLLVQLYQPITKVGDLHVPAWKGPVDDWRVRPPAVWVVVLVGLVFQEASEVLEVTNDVAVRFENVATCEIVHLVGELALVVDRHDHAHTVLLGDALIVLAEAWCHVHDSRAFFGFHEVPRHHTEGVQVVSVGKVLKQRFVCPVDEIAAANNAVFDRALQLLAVIRDGR